MANAVKTLSDIIRKGAIKTSASEQNTGMTVKPNYIKLIERENVSDEVLQANASDYADSLYADSINKTKLDAEKKLNDLNSRLEKTAYESGSKRQDAEAEYRNAMEKNVNNAVKQGIVNSSMFEMMKEKTKANYSDKLTEINDALKVATEGLKREADVIIKARDVALSNYEIKKAAEYEKRLQELREAEYNAREEVRKKNEILSKYIESYDSDAALALSEWEDAKKKGQI